MGKRRVHEVAKDIGLESKELLRALAEVGINVRNVLSTLEDHEIAAVTRHIRARQEQKNALPETEASPAARTRPKKASAPGGAQGPGVTSAKDSPASPPPPKSRPPRLSQFGPGLVDKVPQRPPDRRFLERPLNIPGHLQPPVRTERQAAVPAPAQEGAPTAAASAAPAKAEKVGSTPPAGTAAPPATGRPAPVRPADMQPPKPAAQRPPEERPGVPRPPEQRAPFTAVSRPQGAAPHPQGGAPRPETAGPRPQAGGAPRAQGPGPRPQGAAPRLQVGGPRPQAPPRQGAPRPGAPGRPAGRAPGRRPALDLSRAIPKPPAEVVEAARLEKGGGQQRLAANREQGRGAGRKWDGSRKQGFNENKLMRSRQVRARAERVPMEKKLIVLTDSLTIKDLAEKMSIKAADVIKRLMEMGTMATINQEIDVETAAIIVQEFGFPVEIKQEADIEALQLEAEAADDPANLVPRPPVVVVMGHVDHGKTSLLDAIRDTNVTATEHGGITQHIGAYQVQHKGKRITFLDTPGHEAFTAMRARGARVTDIAILVVAADDGVKPQTVEAINHARAAGIPIIVAINKIDKPEANPERVKQQLTEHGLVAEEWGGDTVMVPVSALTRQGLGDLLEMVLLVAEMAELRANPNRPARGTIIESRLDKGRGPVATVLVQNGTLKSGDALVAGSCFARVRAMMDYKGRRVKKAGPSTPVEVLGFSEVPAAGDTFFVTDDEKLARQIADKRQMKKRQDELRASGRLSLEDVFKRIQEGEVKELPLILKADVQGSVEALAQALERLSTDEVKVQIIHQGVGAITETDIMLASASNAVVIGFNVRPDINARRAAEHEKVDIRLYQVIYDAINDVRAALTGLLEPEYREVTIGQAEVRKVFRASKIGTIAGCYVLDGKISRDANVRVVRDGVLIHEGKLSSLKRFKDDVKEVAQGYECGLTVENFNDIEEGDQLEFYTIETVRRELS